MMIKNMKRAFVLGLTALVLFAGIPAPKVMAADNAPLHTKVSVSGTGSNQKISYRLSIDSTKVTDGRIAVEYDPEVLALDSVKDKKDRFGASDINTEYTNGENKGVSYAFAADRQKTINGQVLAITFKAKAGIENQNTTVKTYVYGLNNETEEILTDVVLDDTINVGRPLPTAPSKVWLTHTLISLTTTWKSAANADGYVVYRSDGKDGDYKEIAETPFTFYYDPFIKNNTTYYYRVASFQRVGGKRVVSEPSKPVSGTIRKFFGWFG